MSKVSLLAVVLGLAFMAACGGQAPVISATPGSSAPAAGRSVVPPAATSGANGTPPSLAASATAAASTPVFAHGTVVFRSSVSSVTMPVEVADDEAKREYGLMNRQSLPADAGMIFVFQPAADPAQVGFWMKDTLIPLSIAFVSPQLTISSIQEMQAESLDVHRPPEPYVYAVEANQGYFSRHGISVGAPVTFTRSSAPGA